MFGGHRTADGVGVTVPSQKRYVGYYEQLQATTPQFSEMGLWRAPSRPLQLMDIALEGVPDFSKSSRGCRPYFKVEYITTHADHFEKLGHDTPVDEKLVLYDWCTDPERMRFYSKDESSIQFDCSGDDLVMDGDIKITFYHQRALTSQTEMFHFWFHTSRIPFTEELDLTQAELDGACKDKKRYPADFKINLRFRTNDEALGVNTPRTQGNMTLFDDTENEAESDDGW